MAAPNDLVKFAGGLTTAMLAVAVLLDPPLVEVACTLLTAEPATVPVTFTVKVQVAPGARLTLERLTLPLPATAVAVPPHWLFRPLGVDTTMPTPAGSVSVNATPLNVT